MTATAHAIIGTIIAAEVSNPLIAIPLSFLSHVPLDMVPHWDTGTERRKKSTQRLFIDTAIDLALGFILSYLIIFFIFPKTNPSYVFLMIISSQGLDWLTAPYYFFNLHVPPFSWFYKFQKMFNSDLGKPWGIISQALAVGLVLFSSILMGR